jgi:RNA polymerase sigma-70 factor (ECF subfamily)
MNERTSATLLRRVGQRDNAAWNEFVQLYTPLLFHWALKSNLQGDDAAELVQEVFVSLLTLLPTFEYDRQKSFRAWLYTVIRSKWSDLLRKRGRLPPGDDGLSQAEGENNLVELEEQEFHDFLVQRALELVEQDFGAKTVAAFRGVALQDRSGKDVAAELGMTEDAVYHARSRVMKRLREHLDGMWIE